uniref:ABC transporter ATP-binding protein n=1 Tax=Arachnia propionica TaxID=1750 RepID=UPI0030C6BE59
MLNCLGLLLPVTQGQILIDGVDMTRLRVERKRRFWRDNVAFVFQDFGLVPDESVGFNVCMESAPILQRRKGWAPRVEEALARVGLAGRSGDQVAKLSGGERQRVSIARAIFKQARVIFADEPTASLDAVNRQNVQDLLLGEQERGATVVISTHDDQLASACDQRLRL